MSQAEIFKTIKDNNKILVA